MKERRLLAGLLVGIGLCFMAVAGHGKVKALVDQTHMDTMCLSAQIEYIMRYPINFLYVKISYDPTGLHGALFPEDLDIDTKDKICISIFDNRGVFSDKSGHALLMQFKIELEAIWSSPSIDVLTDYENEDIVATFYNREQVFLGYFYQGEYYLWEE